MAGETERASSITSSVISLFSSPEEEQDDVDERGRRKCYF
jgi:hypothetical protein